MYERVVKIVAVNSDEEKNEDLQYGILDTESNMVMGGFITYDEAVEELEYRKEEEEKIGDFGGKG